MRSMPALLQADLDTGCTTLCDLLQVMNAEGETIGMTSLDRSVTYDAGDDWGEIDHEPDPGFQSTDIEAAHDLSVDGGDGEVLLPIDALPMNAEDIRRGLWDDARFRVLRVNYLALNHGHYEVCSGTFGDITLRDDALLVIQLDGNARPLRQTMCWNDSIPCRAIFGSQEDEEIEYCGFDVTPLWVSFTVDSVDADEPDRVFTASELVAAAGAYVPGAVLWDTGDNATYLHPIDSSSAGGELGLRIPTRWNIQAGDTGRARVDCTKDVEGDKGCRDHWGDDWVLHHRGEPDIPLGGQAQVPGAEVSPGSGGVTTVPDSLEEA